jgi:membrane-bound lytic murein transglycosylase D
MIRKRKAIITLMAIIMLLFSVRGKANVANADPYKQSLEVLQKKVPLTYNESVRKAIESYTGQKSRFAEMIGLSKYYFPIYEKVFRERNVPDELKYISVIESSLNPQAVSRAGATGPWQFLYEMGKLYGLTVNDSIDERKDPVLACNAAASYLLDSYAMYDDWLLTIASYNCGRNNIKWAIEKAGGQKDYWAIRQYLPVETQNYVPAYIATVYLMNNYQKHGINPVEPYFNIQTEVLTVKMTVSLDDIARQANLRPAEISNLNPSYKRFIVNGTKELPRNVVIPVLSTPTYNAVCRMLGLPERVIQAPVVAEVALPLPVAKVYSHIIMYRAQEGDTFDSIAGKFEGVNAEDIKNVNNLNNSGIITGNFLQIPVEKM